jgi:hypothetical protein
VHESVHGTELTSTRLRRMSAFEGPAVSSLDQVLVSNWPHKKLSANPLIADQGDVAGWAKVI